MKIDKETLIKNRFWVLLGVFVPLELFAILWLTNAVEGAVEEAKRKIADHRSKLEKNASQPKLPGMAEMNLCKHKEDILGRRKEKIWQEAWDLQQGFIFWPQKVSETYADLPFGKSVSDSVRTTYAQTDVYLAQYEAMAKTFQVQVPEKDRKTRKPVIDQKTGKPKTFTIDPVQFEGGWEKVLHPVKKWKVLPPSDEEVWLAQEDVWVRHEILEALKEANGSVARYKRTGAKLPDQGPPFEQTFENSYWKIELILDKKDQQYYIKGKITNKGKKRLALGRAFFWLQVQRDDKEQRLVLPIEGESRAVGESWDIKEMPLDVLQDPAGLFGLEQIFEPRTVPVRRIDDIVLFYHSHRTYEPTLLSPKQFTSSKPPPPPTGGLREVPSSVGRRQSSAGGGERDTQRRRYLAIHRRDRPGAADAAGPGAGRRSSAHSRGADGPVQFQVADADHSGKLAALPRHPGGGQYPPAQGPTSRRSQGNGRNQAGCGRTAKESGGIVDLRHRLPVRTARERRGREDTREIGKAGARPEEGQKLANRLRLGGQAIRHKGGVGTWP